MGRNASGSHGFIVALLINMIFRLEWLLAALAAYLLHRWLNTPMWICWAILGLWVLWSAIITMFVTWASGCSEANPTPGRKYASDRLRNREDGNMAFFDMFKKKECDICGGDIGLLGNRKLEDGNMCKDCAKKLSPWFDDRRHSTIDEIKQQLEYREKNQAEMEAFSPTNIIGEYYKIFAEEKNGIPSRFVISMTDNYKENNADIISFKNVSAVRVDIDERRTELKRENEKGERVSYDPPRYEFKYDFYIELDIDSIPYFDNIRFKVNVRTVEIESELYSRRSGSIGQLFSSNNQFDPSFNREYQRYIIMCDEIQELFDRSRKSPAPTYDELMPKGSLEREIADLLDQARASNDPSYAYLKTTSALQLAHGTPYYDNIEKEASIILACIGTMKTANEAPAPAAPAAAEQAQKFCPNCGAPADDGKFCQNCGTKLR